MFDLWFGPDIWSDRYGVSRIVPVTTSIENVLAIADHVNNSFPTVQMTAGPKDGPESGIDREQLAVVLDRDDLQRERIKIVGHAASGGNDFEVFLCSREPSFFMTTAEYRPLANVVAQMLRRDGQRHIPQRRVFAIARAMAYLTLLTLAIWAWVVVPGRFWPLTVISTGATLIIGRWVRDYLGENSIANESVQRRDRTRIHHKSRRQILEDRVSMKTRLLLGVGIPIVTSTLTAVITLVAT